MEKELDFIAERIEKYIEDTKKITATPGKGVTRLPFTLESKRCVHYLEKQMSQMGLDVIEDASGAVIGILKGKSPERIMIGSHYDSVEHGGGYLSSKAFLGKWTTNDLKDYVDKNGISYYDAMILYGYSPEHLIRAERPRKGWKGYLEIHVEQGPIMEDQGTEIGIVETIVAIERYYITIIGKADHAGTQPMDTRSDAVMAAVDVITKLRQYVMEHKGMVGTVGEIHVYPNQINIVPEKITFSIDVRSADLQLLTDPSVSTTMIASNEAQFYSVSNYQAINLVDKGTDVCLLAPTVNAGNTQVVVAGADSGIVNAKDMEGKRMGYTDGAGVIVAVQNMCDDLGVDFDSIELVNLQASDMLASLESGDIDCFAAWEPWGIRAEEAGAKVLFTGTQSYFPENEGEVDYLDFMVAINANREFVEENPDTAEAYVRAIMKATD